MKQHVKSGVLQLVETALMLALLSHSLEPRQWFSLLAIPLLMLYNGQRGKWKLKYLFYIFYPAHLGILYLISLL